jgi:dTDP-4-dehydrorhamnose reductase
LNDRVKILGSNGQLGTALCKLFKKENIDYVDYDLPEIDIKISETYQKKIVDYKPDVLINCVAYTDVYKAETDIENAIIVNGIALKQLVDICNRNNIYLCHISTNYVFDGIQNRPYSEGDLPNPINIYGLSKYIGEKIIQLHSDNYVIVRTAALYGNSKNDSINIVKKVIKIAKKNGKIKLVNDEFISPTFADDLARQIRLIIESNIQGIVHATSEGYCNWVEFGSYLFELLNIDVEIEEVKSLYFNTILKKPKYSVLGNNVLKGKGINIMPYWEKALEFYLNEK